MSKPVKKVGRAFDKAVIRPLGDALETVDRAIGPTAQAKLLRSGVKRLVQVPDVQMGLAEQQSRSQVNRAQVMPSAPIIGEQENQMESSRELYRRRRSRGMATGPSGLSSQAPVRRKTLLGE